MGDDTLDATEYIPVDVDGSSRGKEKLWLENLGYEHKELDETYSWVKKVDPD